MITYQFQIITAPLHVLIGIMSGGFHEDITEQLEGTAKTAKEDLDQSGMDRTITVSFAENETKTAL